MLLQSIYLILQIEDIKMQVFILILEVLDIRRQALLLHEFPQTLVLQFALVLKLQVVFLEGLESGRELCLHFLH